MDAPWEAQILYCIDWGCFYDSSDPVQGGCNMIQFAIGDHIYFPPTVGSGHWDEDWDNGELLNEPGEIVRVIGGQGVQGGDEDENYIGGTAFIRLSRDIGQAEGELNSMPSIFSPMFIKYNPAYPNRPIGQNGTYPAWDWGQYSELPMGTGTGSSRNAQVQRVVDIRLRERLLKRKQLMDDGVMENPHRITGKYTKASSKQKKLSESTFDYLKNAKASVIKGLFNNSQKNGLGSTHKKIKDIVIKKYKLKK